MVMENDIFDIHILKTHINTSRNIELYCNAHLLFSALSHLSLRSLFFNLLCILIRSLWFLISFRYYLMSYPKYPYLPSMPKTVIPKWGTLRICAVHVWRPLSDMGKVLHFIVTNPKCTVFLCCILYLPGDLCLVKICLSSFSSVSGPIDPFQAQTHILAMRFYAAFVMKIFKVEE